MNKLLFIIPFLFFCLSSLQSQTIESKKVFGGTKYTLAGDELTMSDMVDIMVPYPEAQSLMKKARSNNTVSTILGAIGGGLIGWPVGTALGGGDPNWALAGIGAVALGIGIPISISANKKARQAVNIYNSKVLPSSEDGNSVGLRCSLFGAGIQLSFSF